MMAVLIMLLGVIAVAAGVFGLGLGVPVRDTSFGAAVLVSSSVAITGGFILLGLAVAVSELRRALQTGMRQMRLPPDRMEPERGARRAEPRLAVPGSPGGTSSGPSGPAFRGGVLGGTSGGTPDVDAADVIPSRFDAPEVAEWPRQPARKEWPPLDAGFIPEPPPFQPASSGEPRRVPVPPPAPERLAPEPPPAPERLAPERLDAIRPADYRKPAEPGPEQRVEVPAVTSAGDVKTPPPPEASGAAIRPVRVLKSGTFNDVSYTLFSDGSIETQTPDGMLRFGSIDEFRRHLEKIA
jgi:hypothetical protein